MYLYICVPCQGPETSWSVGILASRAPRSNLSSPTSIPYAPPSAWSDVVGVFCPPVFSLSLVVMYHPGFGWHQSSGDTFGQVDMRFNWDPLVSFMLCIVPHLTCLHQYRKRGTLACCCCDMYHLTVCTLHVVCIQFNMCALEAKETKLGTPIQSFSNPILFQFVSFHSILLQSILRCLKNSGRCSSTGQQSEK